MAKLLSLTDFSGGLNTRLHPSRIADNESPVMRNVFYRDRGVLTKRLGRSAGIAADSSTNYDFLRGFTYRRPESTTIDNRTFVTGTAADTRNILYESTNSSVTAFDAVVVTLANTLNRAGSATNVSTTSGKQTTLSVFNDKLLINHVINGAATFQDLADYNCFQWAPAGGAVRIASSPVLARSLVVHKDYVFTANDANDTAIDNNDRLMRNSHSTLRWSGRRDETLWPTNHNIIIGPRDGFPIMAIVSFGDTLTIFKSPRFYAETTTTGDFSGSSMWQLFGNDFDPASLTYELRRVFTPSNVGLAFKDTLATWQNTLMMLTNDGVYAFDGSNFAKITSRIQSTVDGWSMLRTGETVINADASECGGIVWKDNYLLSVLERGSDLASTTQWGMGAVYVFTPEGTIWRWVLRDSANNNGIGHFVIDPSGRLLGLGHRTAAGDGQVYVYPMEQTTYADGTGAIDAMWTSKEFDLKETHKFDHVYVHFSKQLSGTLRLEVSVDGGTFEGFNVPMSYTYGSIIKSNRIIIGKRGRTIQFRVSNAEPYVNFEVHEIELHGNPVAVEHAHGG